ncbi:hypothetical protein RND71_026431 [Anisodus tanguticus]|uniref:Uncharacterized protein n=1 Tax=Anisodus tanguticus TaxID=243964 RepID=A0AAE1RNE5_9SOLA|nr:hypothetical protein RND71_026431 [Anisodus tanguticus]
MIVHGEETMFDVFKATKFPAHYEELKMITVVEPEISFMDLNHFIACRDPLERALVYDGDLVEDEAIEECLHILVPLCKEIDHARSLKSQLIGRNQNHPLSNHRFLNLKPYTSHLRYDYLGSDNTLPVIFYALLSDVQVERVL